MEKYIVLREKSYLCCQLDIFSSIQMRHGSLFKLRPCGKAIAIQCQHFNACSTGSSTVGWKRGIKLLVLLSRKSINWSRLQHTLKQQYRYKSQNTMAKLHHTVKYRCRHARAWTGLCILHISTGTFSHNCKVLSGGDLPPSLKSAFVLCTHYGKCTLTYTLQNNRTGISSNMKTVHALPL